MTRGEAVPAPSQVPWVAKANIVLGIVSLVRFGPEIVLVLQHHPDWSYFAVLGMDILIACLWLQSGRSMRNPSEGSLRFASIAGAAIFAHGAMSGFFFGRETLRGFSHLQKDAAILAFIGSRLLIYLIELGFWPCALVHLTRLAAERGRRPRVLIAAGWSFVLAAAVQGLLLAATIARW